MGGRVISSTLPRVTFILSVRDWATTRSPDPPSDAFRIRTWHASYPTLSQSVLEDFPSISARAEELWGTAIAVLGGSLVCYECGVLEEEEITHISFYPSSENYLTHTHTESGYSKHLTEKYFLDRALCTREIFKGYPKRGYWSSGQRHTIIHLSEALQIKPWLEMTSMGTFQRQGTHCSTETLTATLSSGLADQWWEWCPNMQIPAGRKYMWLNF